MNKPAIDERISLAELILIQIRANEKSLRRFKDYFLGYVVYQQHLPFETDGSGIIDLTKGFEVHGFKEHTRTGEKIGFRLRADSLDTLCDELIRFELENKTDADGNHYWLRLEGVWCDTVKTLPLFPLGPRFNHNLQRLVVVATLLELIGEAAFDPEIQTRIENIFQEEMANGFNGNSYRTKAAEQFTQIVAFATGYHQDDPNFMASYFYDPRGLNTLFDFARWYQNSFICHPVVKDQRLCFSAATRAFVNRRFAAVVSLPESYR